MDWLTNPNIGVVSRNRRKFRHSNFNPANSASRSIIFPSLWKVWCPFSRICRQAAGDICVICASALALSLASYFVSSRDGIGV
jgi:hypothetical protein